MPNRSRICVLMLAWMMATIAVPISAGSDAFAQVPTTARAGSSPSVVSRCRTHAGTERVRPRGLGHPGRSAALPLRDRNPRALARHRRERRVARRTRRCGCSATRACTRAAPPGTGSTRDSSTAAPPSKGSTSAVRCRTVASTRRASPSRFIPIPKNVYLPDGSKRSCVKSTGDAGVRRRAGPLARWCWPATRRRCSSPTSRCASLFRQAPPGRSCAPRVGATCSTTGACAISRSDRSTCSGPTGSETSSIRRTSSAGRCT